MSRLLGQATRHPSRRLGLVLLLVLGPLLSSLALAAPAAASSGTSPTRSAPCQDPPLTCAQLVGLGFSYPYRRQPGSYLFVNGAAFPYAHLTADPLGNSTVRVGGAAIPVRRLLDRLGLDRQQRARGEPVIAYGSNANVDALTRKYVTSGYPRPAVFAVTKARLRDYDVVWSPHFVFNGAMPATFAPSPGTTVEVWINWLDPAELKQMNETEGAGSGLYAYGSLHGASVEVPAGPRPRAPGIYLDCAGALQLDGGTVAIADVAAAGRRFQASTSGQALAAIAPRIGWRRSTFDLVAANVRSASDREARSKRLERLGDLAADPHFKPSVPCASGD